MFSPLFLTFVSTGIIGGIVYIIFNLIFNPKEDQQKSIESTSGENEEFVDNSLQQKDNHFIESTNELKTEAKPQETVPQEVTKNDESSEETQNLIELSSIGERPHEVPDNQTSVEKSGHQTNESPQIEDLFDFVEINESNELTDERPVEQQIVDEVVIKEEAKTSLNEFNSESQLNSDKQEFENQFIDNRDESEEPEDGDNRFWNLEDSQNLKHLNKSRPKKSKSRPSVKIVFTEEPTDHNCEQQIKEDPISQNARELVDTLFENLDSDVEEYKARTDSENSPREEEEVPEEQQTFESRVSETIEKTIEKNDDSFEELASGEYKKFDEFSESFRSESRKHEVSRKSYEVSSVKSYEITVDSSQPFSEEMLDNLLKNFEAKDTKTEVFVENYNKVTESQTLKLRKGDQTEVIPILNSESVSHSKSFGERSLSSSSLSKMSLEDLDLSLRSSKSRLSETIDTVTKPLLSSPTLFRRPLIQSDEEVGADNSPNESPNRTQFPLFGRGQSSLMKEMKEKEFRKSLKPFTDFKDIDRNAFNE